MHGVFLPHSCHISRMYIPDTTSGKYIMICFRVNFGTSLHLLQTALHCLATYSWLPYVFAPCLSKVRSGFPIAIYLACIESLSNWNTDYNINHWVVVSIFFLCSPRKLGKMSHFDYYFSKGLVQPPTRPVPGPGCNLFVYSKKTPPLDFEKPLPLDGPWILRRIDLGWGLNLPTNVYKDDENPTCKKMGEHKEHNPNPKPKNNSCR